MPPQDAPSPSTRWQTLRSLARIAELRLRFIALVGGTGLFFGYWETLANRFETWNRPAVNEAQQPAGFESFCPMHPNVVREQPGQCPSCGMPLARRRRGHVETLPEGILSRVRLAPGRIARAGIRTVAVGTAPAVEPLTAFGLVGFDETRHVLVSSEARGRVRVDRLLVASEGEPVRAGQPLAELYAYDVSQAIRVYLEARRVVPDSSDPRRTPLGDPAERTKIAARGLKVLGVRQDQIDALTREDRSESDPLLPLLAPIDGHVVKKSVTQGQYVSEGTTLFEIADLSRVWVHAQVFEDQVALIHEGQPVEAKVAALPGARFSGRVARVAPTLDPLTRTAAVRFELDNPGHRLRPGMLATVTVDAPGEERSGAPTARVCPVSRRPLGSMGPAVRVALAGRTASVCCDGCVAKLTAAPERYLGPANRPAGDRAPSVPESAVIATGENTIVYVEVEPGVFEGRAVVLGPRSGSSYPVREGLVEGDRVAAEGAFIIDAESRLRASGLAGQSLSPPYEGGAGGGSAGVGFDPP